MNIKKFFNSLVVGVLLALSLIFPSLAATTASSVASKTAAATAKPVATSSLYYTNSKGEKVHRPVAAKEVIPAGASAQCKDNTFSFSKTRRGTCSHHGGVKKWL